jgi:hypothetical protein
MIRPSTRRRLSRMDRRWRSISQVCPGSGSGSSCDSDSGYGCGCGCGCGSRSRSRSGLGQRHLPCRLTLVPAADDPASSLSFVTDAATLCSGSYSINGSGFSSACDGSLKSLPGGVHQVIFQSNTSTGTSTGSAGSGSGSTIEFRFYGVSGTVDSSSSSSSSSSLSNITLDDTSFGYSSDWDHVVNGSIVSAAAAANETAAESVVSVGGWYNSSASVTTALGASANLTFTGGTVYLFGATGPAGGEAEVYLDGQLRSSLDLSVSLAEEWGVGLQSGVAQPRGGTVAQRCSDAVT